MLALFLQNWFWKDVMTRYKILYTVTNKSRHLFAFLLYLQCLFLLLKVATEANHQSKIKLSIQFELHYKRRTRNSRQPKQGANKQFCDHQKGENLNTWLFTVYYQHRQHCYPTRRYCQHGQRCYLTPQYFTFIPLTAGDGAGAQVAAKAVLALPMG